MLCSKTSFKGRVEEVDNPPASSCRVPLPVGIRRTPGTTELGRKTPKKNNNERKNHKWLSSLTQETQLAQLRGRKKYYSPSLLIFTLRWMNKTAAKNGVCDMMNVSFIVPWSASVCVSYRYSFHHQSGSLRWCRTGTCWESVRTSEPPQNSLGEKRTVTWSERHL